MSKSAIFYVCDRYKFEKPVFIDPGVETYSRKTFSSERYTIWTMRSLYHNLPEINNTEQQAGDYHAEVVSFDGSSIRSSRGCGMVADRGEMRGPTELILPEFGKIRSTEKYRLLFNSLIDSSLSENIFRREICNGIISQILCELSDTFLRSGERERKPSNRALTENVIEYIRINASSIKNVSDVAEHFGYNPEYLTTLVKKKHVALADRLH